MAYINASKNAGLKKNRITKREKKSYINVSDHDEKNRGGLLGGAGYLLGNAALGFGGVLEGIGDIGSAAGDILRGDTAMAKYRFLDNDTAEAREKLIERYNPNKAMQIAGDVSSGIGNSLTFMIPYVGPYMAAAGYTGMGISSAAEKTGDVGIKEIGYGAASGALEFGLEALTGGIGKAGKNLGAAVSRTLGREAVESTAKAAGQSSAAKLASKITGRGMLGSVLKETAKGAAGEFAEEALSEAIDPALQIIFGVDPNASTSIRDIAYAGFVGALSGGLMTAGPAAINYKSSVKAGKYIRESGETEALLNRAKLVLSGSQRTIDKYKTQAEAAKLPKDASALQKVAGVVNPMTEGRKTKRAGSRITTIAETVKKNLDTYERYRQNPNKTQKELEISDAVLGELRGNLFILENASLLEVYEEDVLELSDEDKQEFVNRTNQRAKDNGRKKFDYTIKDLEANTDDILTAIAQEELQRDQYGDAFESLRGRETERKEAPQSPVKTAQPAETEKAEEVTNQPAKPATKKPASVWEGLKPDTNVQGYAIQNKEEAELLSAAVEKGIPQKSIPAMLGSFRASTTEMTPAEFADGWNYGVNFVGRYNVRPEAASSNSAFAYMDKSSRDTAAAYGQALAKEQAVREQAEADQKKAPATSEADARRKSEGRATAVKRGVGLIIQDLDDRQYSAYKAAEILAPVLGTDIVIDKSIGTKSGKQVNGYYDAKDNSIHVNISAARDGKHIALYTLAHEVTHYVKAWSPEKFYVLSDYVMERMSKSAESLIKAKVSHLRDIGAVTETMTEQEITDLAREEVVADGMELILTDGKVLNELAQKDKTLWQKIKDWVRNVIARVKKTYEGLNQESKTAKTLRETLDSLEEIERLFTEGVTEAGERVRTADHVIIDEASGTALFSVEEKTRSKTREITSRVRTVRRILGTLNTMLYNPNKQKHVPEGLQALTETVLRSADPKAFAQNRDHIREMAELASEIESLERKVARTASEQERLEKMKSKYEHLEAETISTKRQAEALLTAFKTYQENTTDELTFDKALLDNLESYVKKIEEAPLTEMTLESITAVEEFYKMLKHKVDTANTTFATERKLNVNDLGKTASDETRSTKSLAFLSPKGNEWAAKAGIRKFFWQNMKPLTVFEAIGSKTFTDLFQNVLKGEEVWAKDILEAREKIVKAREEHGYKEWDMDERVEVKTKSGTVALSLAERMSLYAYSFRAQANSHLEGGGFVLDPRATAKEKVLSVAEIEKRLNDPTRYTMDQMVMGELANNLTEPQKAYVREIQKYLTDMGNKGNEVSLKLYGIKLFTEEYYFPIKVKSEYLASQTGKSGDPNIKNRGMTKEIVPNAKEPLVLLGFDEIMTDHINSMATYHAFVLPIEDLTRVLNYKPANYLRDENGDVILDENGMPKADTDAEQDYSTLKAVIESKYGAAANDYIVQLIRDLNGGARRDAAAGIIDKGITAFKRASTMASLSVLVQQPTSIIRAAAYIEPKYLFGNASIVDFKNHKELWEKVKKYAPVAIIKEMGGYDTGVGARTSDYLNATVYEKGERIKGFLSDSDYRAEVFGIGAAYADEMAWIQLFEACVSEQADKQGKARDSEEVLKAAGERFTEVVRHTQVYDSTLTRSENMRSKDTGMKMLTAFMAEPTTVVSMVAEAIMKAERGDVKFLRNTAGAVIGSIILNALLSSLVYAMRDDDEEKSYGEKYVSTVAMETAESLNTAEYFPVFRDIMSLVKGYEVERADMALVGDLVNSIRRINSSQQSVGQKMANTGGTVAAFFGLPVSNVMRDVNGLIYTFFKQTDTERFTGKGLSAAMKEEFDIMWGLWDEEITNGYQLYQSALDGDGKHYARVAARYESTKEIEQALRKALRSYEPRINEAAEARINGELEIYEEIVERIASEGHFDRDITIRAINNQISHIKDHLDDETVPEAEDEEETAESLYKTSDLNAALERGDRSDFTDVYKSLLAYRTAAGKTEAQAKSELKSSITAHWKKQYLAAWEANDTTEIKRIQAILLSTSLYGSRNDVTETCQGWVKAYAKILK